MGPSELLVNLLLNCKHEYSEGISTASHSYQAALLASRAGASRVVVLASLFHDIGHMFAEDDTGGCGAADHSSASASVLRHFGFEDAVCTLVQEHANAKRYLVSIDRGYAERLSPASRVTLAAQGGPMGCEERARFENHPFFSEILALRRFDDAAKRVLPEPTRAEMLSLLRPSKL